LGVCSRKQKEQKKYAKQVQSAKLQDRAKEKRQNLEKINRMKKDVKGSDLSIERSSLDFLGAPPSAAGAADDGGEAEADRPNKRQKTEKGAVKKGGLPAKGKKRQAKDAKYGYGGKKSGKRNDAESVRSLVVGCANRTQPQTLYFYLLLPFAVLTSPPTPCVVVGRAHNWVSFRCGRTGIRRVSTLAAAGAVDAAQGVADAAGAVAAARAADSALDAAAVAVAVGAERPGNECTHRPVPAARA
jgi:hypothetical protein